MGCRPPQSAGKGRRGFGEGTFAGEHSNGEEAPIPVVHGATAELLESTLKGSSGATDGRILSSSVADVRWGRRFADIPSSGACSLGGMGLVVIDGEFRKRGGTVTRVAGTVHYRKAAGFERCKHANGWPRGWRQRGRWKCILCRDRGLDDGVLGDGRCPVCVNRSPQNSVPVISS